MNMNHYRPVILADQRVVSDFELDPLTRKISIKILQGHEQGNKGMVDTLRQNLQQRLGVPVEIPLALMNHLVKLVRDGNEVITATLAAGNDINEDGKAASYQVIDAEPGDHTGVQVGLAIDIGTTTVVVYLVNMVNGDIMAKASDYNGQIKLGDDILSRIMAAREKKGLKELQALIVNTLNALIQQLCLEAGLKQQAITGVCIGANTTMVHLCLGLDPGSICRAPYRPAVNNAGIFCAGEIGLAVHPLAPTYCLPSIGSYIGGDVLAGILVSGMHKQEEVALLADIGTNGEFILGNQEWLVGCAGAAGPALEGGVTEWGIRAEQGAVDQVSIDSEHHVGYTTIDNAPARGICGSGLIDSLAELFLNGLINRAARFTDGRERFTIVPADESATGKEIFISQKDINSLMRTKGAVNAALEVLMESVGCQWEEIAKFYAAGAFGQYLPIESAVTIGLYPDLPREQMLRLGNSSGEGARQVLLSNSKRQEIEEIAGKITYFEMNASSSFMDKYGGSRFLPHTNMDLFPSVQEKLAVRQRSRC
ncbi:ferredoxin [Desulfitobacterium hafniense]|uniref:Ferredoxin n=1 Tax=Desulfitobacterium hafniense TaxID=49338 RepID=A0A0W1JLJ6_DESHA|nr:ASKHA domain-containing protein [Desulfitobacterium hafniense]KTE92539.1 ferredoxin [Desulfitobacterium hafniense]